MTQVVQAACPGCKKTLRIPAQWISQPMRCKYCGLIIQAKASPASGLPAVPANGPSSAVTARTPPPASLLERLPSKAVSPAVPPPPAAAPRASGRPAPETSRAKGGWGKGLFLALCVLLVAGIISAVYWPKLSGLQSVPAAGPEAGKGQTAETDRTDTAVVTPTPPPARPADPPPMREPVKPADPVKPPVRPSDPPPQTTVFPRRALAVSVNNYLYANPVHFGSPSPGSRNVQTLLERLNGGLRIPMDQMALLSDAAPAGLARPPLRPVIEKTVSDFLSTSREQDCILLLFIGHAVEIEDEAYLVPFEGDPEAKDTLIPLKWLYERLAACKARQKVLIVDVCRLSPSRGQERPGSGPMGAKLDAALKMPPPGVQVWSACVAEQSSHELESAGLSNGVFQDALHEVLSGGIPGSNPQPNDLVPVGRLVEFVNQRMKEVLDREKKVQTSRLTGQEPAAGAAYNPAQPRPPRPAIQVAVDGGAARAELVKAIVNELELPSIGPGPPGQPLRLESLPLFSVNVLDEYKDDGQMTPFREAVIRTRDLLNQRLRGRPLRYEFRAPANEARFKDEIKDYQTREVATLIGELSEALDSLKAAGKERDKEMSKRWQANYDYFLARLEMQIAFLYEYTTMLGSMRKDLPPRDPQVHGGWRLAAQPALQGDAAGKRLANDAKKVLEKLANDHRGTPWEVLARRERSTALGLDWQPVK